MSRSFSQWKEANDGLYGGIIYALAIDLATNYIYAAPFINGGIFLSTDNGSNWTAIDNGLSNPDVRAIAISGSNIYAGTTGGGVFLSTNNGSNWTAVNNGLSERDYVRSLAISGSNIFAGTYGGGVFLSTNNGSSWIEVNNGLTEKNVYSLAISEEQFVCRN